MIKHSEYLAGKKDNVSGNNLMSQELYDFYMKLFLAQEEFLDKCQSLPEGYIQFRNDSLPALSVDDITIDTGLKELLDDLLRKIASVISEVNSGMNFSHLIGSFKAEADTLLRSLLKQDHEFLENKGKENRLDLDEFIFILHNVFKPFMVRLKECFDLKIKKEDWLKGNCPVCGYLPDMSKIVESRENQRLLNCSICEHQWEFPRLVCPVCGCDEQSKHGFFEYEDDNNYRVYYCDECKHYIKSIRVPKLKEESKFDLSVEDIITSFLDASMIEKGYKRI